MVFLYIDTLKEFLEIVGELTQEVGSEIPQITPQTIMNRYLERGNAVSLKTIYNYLNEANGEFIREETKTVKSYILTPRNHTSSNIPDDYILDADGNEIAPKEYPDYMTYPKGEKTLKSFSLTDKGLSLLGKRLSDKRE